MRVKVRGGTVQHGQPSLCLTCRSATIVKGARLRDDIVECSRLGARVAWVLRSDPRRNEIGFVKASKLKPQDRYVLPDEWD